MAPVDDDDIEEEDEDFAEDGDEPADDGSGDDNLFADDDDDDEDYEDTGEDEDDAERPIYLKPLFLVPVALFLIFAGLGAWLMVSFDDDAYQKLRKSPGLYAAVVTPPPEPLAPAAAPGEAAEAAAAGGAVGAGPAEAEAPAEAEVAAAAPQPPPPPAPEAPAEAPAEVPPEAPAEAPPEPAAEVAAAEPQAPPPPEPEPAPEPAEPLPEPEPRVPLPPAPDLALILEDENGPLPVIGPDGRQPWIVYARPADLPEDAAKVAIVIGGLGMSEAATLAAIQQLPGEVTLAFVPYAPGLDGWIAQARAAGHEVVLQLPMEPEDFPANDPGPYTLLTDVEVEENLARLHWLLSRFTGYVGVTNYMGSRLTTSAEAMEPILADLQSRGLMFLDARETPASVAGDLAAQLQMPHAVNNRFLDREASRVGIDARLFELERIAQSTGAAVGIGFPYPVTIERVAEWIQTLVSKDVVVAPISALASTTPIN